MVKWVCLKMGCPKNSWFILTLRIGNCMSIDEYSLFSITPKSTHMDVS